MARESPESGASRESILLGISAGLCKKKNTPSILFSAIFQEEMTLVPLHK